MDNKKNNITFLRYFLIALFFIFSYFSFKNFNEYYLFLKEINKNDYLTQIIHKRLIGYNFFVNR